MSASDGTDSGIEASVVVPTHARPERLARLLESLAVQTLPAESIEIVVVDDGSPPERAPAEERLPRNARIIRQQRQGPAAARNAGAAGVRGRLLAFVDDDCVAAPDWLERLRAAHASHPRALLGGTTVNGVPENLLSDVAESLLGFLDADERRAGRPLSFLASNNIACAREAFVRVGGFDTRYPLAAGEDRAFCREWLRREGELLRVADARVAHFHVHDLRSFWRQQRNYGRGAALFRASEFEGAPTAPVPASASAVPVPSAPPSPRTFGLPRPPAFYARLMTHYLERSDRAPIRRVASLPVLALSQLAVASGSFAERRRMLR